jgi:cytosine/adenosine deaminase-related metal-dependent hydrolase
VLTLHTADVLLPCGGRPPVPAGAVLVDGRTVAAIGSYEQLAAAHPAARVRRWPGVLAPGLRQWHGARLLTHCYHPDPREAGTLGDAPVSGLRFDALAMDPARRAASVRRGVQRMLRHGTTAVATGPDPLLREAVTRVGLVLLPTPATLPPHPDLDPLAAGADLDAAIHAPLTVGARADFAAFAVPAAPHLPGAGLAAHGAATCVATVLGGKLVFRRA